jgi:hypothetical protein
MEFTTRKLTLAERVELNNMMEVENIFDPEGKKIIKQFVRKFFGFQVKAVMLGLDTLNGKPVPIEEREKIVHGLNNDEITIVSNQVFSETNYSKKKNS